MEHLKTLDIHVSNVNAKRIEKKEQTIQTATLSTGLIVRSVTQNTVEVGVFTLCCWQNAHFVSKMFWRRRGELNEIVKSLNAEQRSGAAA